MIVSKRLREMYKQVKKESQEIVSRRRGITENLLQNEWEWQLKLLLTNISSFFYEIRENGRHLSKV